MSVNEIGEKSVKYSFTAKKMDTDVLVAESYVIAIAADRKIGEAIKIPSEIIEKLRAFKNR